MGVIITPHAEQLISVTYCSTG